MNLLFTSKRTRLIFLLSLIILLGIYFRFYNFPNRITTDPDSQRDAFVAIEGARNMQLPLTGPFISIAPVTTGPWYWYQLIVFRKIFPSIYSPWIYLGILSSLLPLIFFRIGSLLESRLYGLILSLIVVFSPQQIQTSAFLTNPSVIGIFSSLVFLIFLEIIIKKRNDRWGLLLGVITGITINIHYQSLLLIIFLLFLLPFKRTKTFLYSLIGLSLTFLPLFFFDLNNHWFNTKHMLDYLLIGQYRIWISNRWLTYILDFWPNFWALVIGGSKLFASTMMILAAIILIKKIKTDRNRKIYLYFALSFLINIIVLRYYRGEKYFGYLQFFQPYIFIFSGLVLFSLWQIKYKIIGLLSLGLYLFLVYPSSINMMVGAWPTNETYNLYNNIMTKWGNHPYSYYICPGTEKVRSGALGLILDLNHKLDPGNSSKIFYFYGNCHFPNIVREGKVIQTQGFDSAKKIFPNTGLVFDISEATQGAVLETNMIKFTAQKEYQSAARWWFDEQP